VKNRYHALKKTRTNTKRSSRVVSEPSEDSSLGWDPDGDADDRCRGHDGPTGGLAPVAKRPREGADVAAHLRQPPCLMFRFRAGAIEDQHRDELLAISSGPAPVWFQLLNAANERENSQACFEVCVPQAHAKRAADRLVLWIKGVTQPCAQPDAISGVPLEPPTAAERAAMSAYFRAAAAEAHVGVHGLSQAELLDEALHLDEANLETAHGVTGATEALQPSLSLPPPALLAENETSIGLEPLFGLLLDACATEIALPQPMLPLPDID
jgi:hypothetical protein